MAGAGQRRADRLPRADSQGAACRARPCSRHSTNGGGLDQGPARAYLARFLFRGDDVFKPVEQLSGGERSRLELALVGLQAANLLLLDEPTNHLDIPAREALETFLRDAPGTVIVVSHDRRLLDAVCTELWVVEDGGTGTLSRVARFAGRFDEWRAAVADGWTVTNALDRAAAPPSPHDEATATA